MAENTNTQVNETHEEEQEESQKPDGVLTKNINGKNKEVYSPYIVATAMIFSDDKVSDICSGNEHQGWIPFTQDFSSGHSAPLGHVNCRCVLRIRPFPPGQEPDGLKDFGQERAFDELPEHYDELSNK